MKRVLVSLAVTAFIVFAFTGISFSETKGLCEGIDKEFISQHVPFQFGSIVETHAMHEEKMCMAVISMQGRNLAVYIPEARKSVIAGDIFQYKTAHSQAVIAKIEQKDFSNVKGEIESAVAFTYKPANSNGKYIYMFTDPDCPYCERAKQPVKDFADINNIEIRVVLYPLPMHPEARPKSVRAICNGMDFNGYLIGNYSGETCLEGEEKINRAMQLAGTLQINGTPTFISSSGKRVSGFAPQQLPSLLD